MRILYIEPWEAGSHAAFTRSLTTGLDHQWTVLTLPGRHWKWRFRGSAPYFALNEPDALSQPFDLIFASSYLPLAELKGLVPSLASVPSILYVHENQLAYPNRPQYSSDRDLHYGFTQMLSALAADRVVFNSQHNHDTFLEQARALLAKMPDALPDRWMSIVEFRSMVLPLPLLLDDPTPEMLGEDPSADRSLGPIILWNHRWEHDKGPEVFFAGLRLLVARGVPFRLIAAGYRARKAPPVFDHAREWLGERVLHWGYADSHSKYVSLLRRAHIAVSTADHEFFGISLLEATHQGAYPLAPNRLVYPEHFPKKYRYRDNPELFARLEALCSAWSRGEALREDRRDITAPYRADVVLPKYERLMQKVAAGERRRSVRK